MNIIAVDDEYLSLIDLEFAIKEAAPDAALLCFENPLDACDFASVNQIDIAYLDINMPKLNGIELAKKLKELNPLINIVFTTGYDEYAVDAFSLRASDYLMKPISKNGVSESLKHLRSPIGKAHDDRLRVQCFGNFDIFLDGKPLYFPRQKAKELLAYLIHRRGTSCSSKEICAVIYEKSDNMASIVKQYQTILSTMMKTLSEAGIENIVIKYHNSISVDVSKLDCDFYRYLDKDPAVIGLYTGEYMANYSWAEFRSDYFEDIPEN